MDTELTATIDPTGLATSAKQDTGNSSLSSINAKLPTLVGGKIPVDASVLIDAIDIGNVDITEFPAGNLGQQLKAASLSVAPATDIADATYLGDIKFGESLPAGSAIVGKVGIDQVTANANEVVVKSQTPPTSLPLPTGAATSAKQLPDGHSVKITNDNSPKTGQKTVATPGTQVALSTTQVYKRLVVIAHDTNTGYIYLGDSTVDSSTGIKLPAGGFFTFYFIDVADIYIDSDVASEGVSFGGEI